MANNNSFNVIKYGGTGKDTLDTILKDEANGKAKFSFDTQNTQKAWVQVKLPVLIGTTLTMKISGVPAWAADKEEPVHFVKKDPATDNLLIRKEVYNTPNENGGDLIPIEYSQAIIKIIIEIETTGANQESILYIGAGFSSRT
jgi:hypothetical protein